MKINKYILLTLYTVALLLLNGCIKDDSGTDISLTRGGKEISFEFAMPQYAQEVLGTRATEPGTTDELKIWDAHLLVFRNNACVNYECMAVDKILDNSTTSPKYRSYFNYNKGDHIVVLLNTGYTTDFPYAAITSISAINTATANSHWQLSSTSLRIPMCGEAVLPTDFTFTAGAGKATVTIPIYRSVSRFKVKQMKALSLDGKTWTIESFGFVNVPLAYKDNSNPAAQHNYIAPTSQVPRLKEPPIADWFTNVEQKTIDKVYYFPSFPISKYAKAANISNTTYHADRAHAIICADWDSKDNYYRIELARQVELGENNNEFRHGEWFDFNKNTSYTIQVNAVNGPGYQTPEEASKNPGKNIVYDVEVDDAYSNFVTSNGQYAIGVSRREVYAPGIKDNDIIDVAYVRYISSIDVTGIKNEIKVDENSVKPAGSTITLMPPTSLTSTSVMLKAKVNSIFEEAIVEVTFGDLKEYITVRRGTYLEVDVDVPDWDTGGSGDFGVTD